MLCTFVSVLSKNKMYASLRYKTIPLCTIKFTRCNGYNKIYDNLIYNFYSDPGTKIPIKTIRVSHGLIDCITADKDLITQ